MTQFNKEDLINAMVKAGEATKVTKAEAERQFANFFAGLQAVVAVMKPDDKLQLVGKMAVEVKTREAHDARNPRTKEVVKVPAKNYTKVTLGSELAGAVVQPSAPAPKASKAKNKKK